MKKYLLGALIALTPLTQTKAQMPYNVTAFTQPYQPLTQAGTINNNMIWHEQRYSVPLGFNFKIGTETVSNLNLLMSMIATDTTGVISGFIMNGGDMCDRGIIEGTTSESPIKYKVTGNPGSRIFKLEFCNAGFYEEYVNYSSTEDSTNMQIWMYEGTNVLEYRFGPSSITHFADYFTMSGATVAYARDLDFMNTDFDVIYLLTGNTTAPTVDSFSMTHFASGFTTYPANGMVYRFTPKSNPTSLANIAATKASIYYTGQKLFVDNSGGNDMEYVIISLTGSLMKRGIVPGGKNDIEIQDLPSGMYVFKMMTDAGPISQSFVTAK